MFVEVIKEDGGQATVQVSDLAPNTPHDVTLFYPSGTRQDYPARSDDTGTLTFTHEVVEDGEVKICCVPTPIITKPTPASRVRASYTEIDEAERDTKAAEAGGRR